MEAIKQNGFACYNQKKAILWIWVCRAVGDSAIPRSGRDLNAEEVSLLKSHGFKSFLEPREFSFNLVEMLIKECDLEEAREISQKIGLKLDEDVPGGLFQYPEARLYSRVIRKYPNFKISDNPCKYPDGTPW